MATNVGTLLVTITSSTTPLVTGLNTAIVAVGAFVAGSVKAAADFDQAFTRVAAISNASSAAIGKMREQVLDLSGETAVAPTELADALFFLASAGLEANQVMPALEVSAKAAAVGLGSTADVANIVASALNAYAGTGLTAANATDILVAAVREGRAEPEEFAKAMGRILPIAARAGVSFAEVAGSLASLSNIGLDVNEGVTAMRGLLQALVAPGKQAAEALDRIGISAQQMRDVISEQGILGGLKLLEERTGGNIDQLRVIIPNIRSLTGELGLMGNNLGSVKDIMDAVRNSTGSLAAAFLETQRSESFKFNKAINDIRIQMIEFGSDILPAVTDALEALGPIIGVLARTFKLLLVGLIAFKTVAFLPALFTNIGTAMANIGTGAMASGFQGAGLALTSFAAQAGVATVATLAIVTAMKIATGEAPTFAATLGSALSDMALKSDAFMTGVEGAQTAVGRLTDRFMSGAINEEQFRKNLVAMGFTIDEVKQRVDAANASMGDVTWHFNRAGLAVRNFAGMSRNALKEWRAGVADSTDVAIGAFDNLNDAFGVTPTEMRRQLQLALTIARRFQRDVTAIMGDKSLTEAQQKALLDLPPAYRDAFVHSKGEARKELVKMATELSRTNARTFQDIANAGKGPAKSGGNKVGAAMGQGVADGIRTGTGPAVAAMRAVVNEAIRAGIEAANAHSPSKRTIRLGEDIINGLLVGLGHGLPSLGDIVDSVIEKIQAIEKGMSDVAKRAAVDQLRGFGRDIADLARRFEHLKSRIDEFRDAIRSGFAQFDLVGGAIDQLNTFNDAMAAFNEAQAAGTLEPGQLAPTAPDLGQFAADQAAAARDLADTLTKLSAAGLNKDLLAQLAAQGPAGTEFGKQLLANPALIASFNQAQTDIAKALGQTTTQLISDRFGKQLVEFANDAERMGRSLRRFIGTLDDEVVPGLERMVRRIDQLVDHLPDVGGGRAERDRHDAEEQAARDDIKRMRTAIEKPARLEMVIRPGSEAALRALIASVISEMGLSRAPL